MPDSKTPTSSSPRWLRTMPSLVFAKGTFETPFASTLLIGIGPTARYVTERITKRFQEVYGVENLTQLSLLQIDLAGGSASRSDTITKSSVSLVPQLDLVERNIKSSQLRNMRWWYAPDLDEKKRPFGRFSLFADLQEGLDQSRLFTAMQNLISQRHPARLWIITSAADAFGSCVAFDVALLAQAASQTQFSRSTLLLSLQGMHASAGMEYGEREPRILASLDELDRLQRNEHMHFNYSLASQDARLRCSVEQGIFDQILLVNSTMTSLRPSKTDPLLDATADMVLSTLNSDVCDKINQAVGNSNRDNNMTLVTLLRSAAMNLPITGMNEVLKWRVADSLIKTWRSRLIEDSNQQLTLQDAAEWVAGRRGNSPPRNGFLRACIAQYNRLDVAAFDPASRNTAAQDLKDALAGQILNILNGEKDEFHASHGRLQLAIDFVERVSNLLKKLKNLTFTPPIPDSGNLFSAMSDACEIYSRQLNDWRRLFQLSGLPSKIGKFMDESRQNLEQSLDHSEWNRRLWSTQVEQSYFNHLLESNSGQSSLLDLALSVTGWTLESVPGESARLSFAVYPYQAEGRFGVFQSDEQEKIISALTALGSCITQGHAKSITLASIIRDSPGVLDMIADEMRRSLEPAANEPVEYDTFKATGLGTKVRDDLIIVGPDDLSSLEILSEQLPGAARQVILGSDPETIVCFRLRSNVPLHTMTYYSHLREEVGLTNDLHGQYAFEAENLVFMANLLGQKIDPSDVAFRQLLHDGELVELFTRAAVLGMICVNQTGQIALDWEGQNYILSGALWQEALLRFAVEWPGKREHWFFGTPAKRRFVERINAESKSGETWSEKCRQFSKQILEPMKFSMDDPLSRVMEFILTEIG